jgi:dienelactone hydrolase
MGRGGGDTANTTAQGAGPDLSTKQEPITLRQDGREMQGVIHRLQEASAMPRPAVAIVQGVVGGSSEHAQHAITDLAEAIARVGMVALQLSLGGDRTPSFDDEMREAQQALDLLSQQQDIDIDHLAVVGPGWSVAAAACLARQDARVLGVVVWGPVGPPTNATTDAQTGDCGRFYPNQPPKGLPAKMLIVHGTYEKSLPPEQVKQLTQSLESAGITSDATVIGGERVEVGGPQRTDTAIKQTVEWLQSVLTSGE